MANSFVLQHFFYFLHKKNYLTSSGSLSELAWRRFRKNKVAFFSLLFIGVICTISIAGFLITPDNTPYANEQNLLLASLHPFRKVNILKIKKNQIVTQKNILERMIFGQENPYQVIAISSSTFKGDSIEVKEYQTDTDSSFLSFHIADVCYALDEKAEIKRNKQNISFKTVYNEYIEKSISELRRETIRSHLATKTYWLGTDRFGRDELSQLIIGARVSLAVGFISVAISLLIGIFFGAIAGYYGGKIDAFISWIINVVWAIPTLLLVIAITFALGKGFWQIFIAVGLTMWVEVARVVRGQFMSLREKEYVEAAKALGYKNKRIIFKHILPNAMAPVIVISAANFASAILLEAGLSFLGIGVQPPMPSWGSMIKENYASIILDYAYLAILPGLAIMLMVLAFMLVGNGLRDAMDVRSIEK